MSIENDSQPPNVPAKNQDISTQKECGSIPQVATAPYWTKMTKTKVFYYSNKMPTALRWRAQSAIV